MELELNIKDKLNDVMRRNKRLADAEVRFYPLSLKTSPLKPHPINLMLTVQLIPG